MIQFVQWPAVIADLGAPLNDRLILSAGLYTFLYIAARGAGKYLGRGWAPRP